MKTLCKTLPIILMILALSCKNKKFPTQPEKIVEIGKADEKSEAIANNVMTAMGGQEKWDQLHYVSWTFFGVRKLTWDKIGGRVRIENPRDSSVYLIDLYNNTGRYSKQGEEVADSTLAHKIKEGKSIWINDSYWLMMPFKLRDKGVNLKYIGEDIVIGDATEDILEMTFDNVGDTPENKYHIHVDKSDNLIKRWDFYAEASQTEPARSWPWDNYKDFDGLLLSTDRSDNSGPSEVKVYKELPDSIFEKL